MMVSSIILAIFIPAIIAVEVEKNTKPEVVFIEKESPVKYDYIGEYTLTWYCTGTQTASGNKVNHQLTAAADIKTNLKFNDVIYIEFLNKPVVVHDTGEAIKGNKIDIYTNDCTEAKNYGVKKSKVYLIGE